MTPIGETAVVVGAGMAGLTSARALAGYFERVLILERDGLPAVAVNRAGIPQGKHIHVLLAGGQRALEALFAGFGDDLARSGAVPVRVASELRTERPGYDPFPLRDFGWDVYWMSRPLIEHTVRDHVRATPNVEIREGCRVTEYVAGRAPSTVGAVRWTASNGATETTESDLVVDASGDARVTLESLRSIGQGAPNETTIGVDIAYSTAVFEIPDDAPTDWKGVYCFPEVPKSGRAALMAPIEGHRWMLTLAGRGGDPPPGDPDGFMAFARSLRMPTIYDAIKDAKRVEEVSRFRFPESRYRHYDAGRFPDGLLPIGDAICRFNPVYGQGMSVAAQQAHALRQLLDARHSAPNPLHGLAQAFLEQSDALIETPWANAAVPDLAYPETRGDRPTDLGQRLRFGAALTALAARDPAVHKLVIEVGQLLKPRSVYRDPDLVSKVSAIMTAPST